MNLFHLFVVNSLLKRCLNIITFPLLPDFIFEIYRKTNISCKTTSPCLLIWSSAGEPVRQSSLALSPSSVFAGLVTSCNDLMTSTPVSSTSLTGHMQTGDDLAAYQEDAENTLPARISSRSECRWKDVPILCEDLESWRYKVALVGSMVSQQETFLSM